jgi:hypothetical protein
VARRAAGKKSGQKKAQAHAAAKAAAKAEAKAAARAEATAAAQAADRAKARAPTFCVLRNHMAKQDTCVASKLTAAQAVCCFLDTYIDMGGEGTLSKKLVKGDQLYHAYFAYGAHGEALWIAREI